MPNLVFLWATIIQLFNMVKIVLSKSCKQIGVDGLIIVDLPWPENKNFSRKCKKNSINFVQLNFSHYI